VPPSKHSSTYGRGGIRVCSGRKPKAVCGSPLEAFQLPGHQGDGEMRSKYAFIAIVTLLSGCGTSHPMDCLTGYLAWDDCPKGSAGYQRRLNAEANDAAKCASYGLQPGTTAYASCRANFAMNRDNANQAALTAAMGNLAESLKPPPTAVVQPTFVPYSQYRPSKSCISNVIGSTVYTNCQ